ncbi:MAG TPA: DUF4129 domain-containing protein [Terriglobales bacterium]|nr:DUF4129 domain-containing protein [Terriglobales bacterium]
MLIRKLAIPITLLLGAATSFAAPALPCDSVAEYRSMLQQVDTASRAEDADFKEIGAQVPWECKFQSEGKDFRISNALLQTQISGVEAAQDSERKDKLAALQRTVADRIKAIDSYKQPIDPTVQPKLKQILANKDFKRVGSQSSDAIVQELLMKLLIKLFSLVAKNPDQAAFFAKIAVWTFIALIAAFLLLKLYRWATQARPIDVPREIIPFAPSAKSWKQWMNEARSALATGNFREAVHSSYWAAISHLESSGAWVPDKARTPREYLRLISRTNPSRALLAEISRVFELVWYGERTPAQSECEAFLARVEQIACN